MDDIGLESSPASVGLREYNRREKRGRIREAAREVFCRRGYLDATTRDIAARARVANGTLFRYARDKRELLLMVINDDLEALQAHKTSGPRRKSPSTIREAILAFYRPRYEYFARYPLVSRPFVSESFNFMEVNPAEVGPEARRNRARRVELIDAIAKLFMDRGPVTTRKTEAAQLAAELVHGIYLSASREWLESSAPDPRVGLRRFDALLSLAAKGFDPA
jgi:AcrR family transcriptional regulator